MRRLFPLLLLAFVVFSAGTCFASHNWNLSTLDSADDVGIYSQITIDKNDCPAINYYDSTNDSIKLAQWDGSIWDISEISSADDVDLDSSFSNLAKTDKYKVEVSDGILTCLKWDGENWISEVVDDSGFVGDNVSLAVNSAGEPYISYYDVKNGDMKLAYGADNIYSALDTVPTFPKITLTTTSESITEGESVTLSWFSDAGIEVTASNFGASAVTGTKEVMPLKTTNYSITVKDAAGKKYTANVKVKVTPLVPQVTITASPMTITQGDSVTLNWTSVNAATLNASNFGATDVSGSLVKNPIKTTTYTISVKTLAGKKASAKVTVKVLPLIPTLTLTASQNVVGKGGITTLTWVSTNAASLVSSNFGAQGINGSMVVTPLKTTTYKITVITAYGRKKTASISIKINTKAPSVTKLQITPESFDFVGGYVTIRASVKSTKQITSVKAVITKPDKSTVEVSMIDVGENTYSGSYKAPANIEMNDTAMYNVVVVATDISALTGTSSNGKFTVIGPEGPPSF